ncbi:MOSC domain-containing protein [Methylotenera versatilis]|jgi:MOSC domain-containing protein YiiM|uniref:MOSC domain containing protein n=1 Tax=Methylotenera versatilis (strain 301) TaxID=666681 RepID=D7DM01_METV0|nr:MOSC domain-containing protein [Methylotenera versatilis]ADI30695.1 MOSC domain containing protein [Methylotenera versatilis 301]
MKLISLNVAQPKTVIIDELPVLTGIYKLPVKRPVWLAKLGLNGDDQADKAVHGGEHQAIYSYPFEHYAYWQDTLGLTDLPYGTFGENLTISGFDEDSIQIGDTLKIGEAIVQVTMPRIPCFKFGHKIGQPDILETFLNSGRSGFYQRVITAGSIKAGDEITLLDREADSITVRTALILQKLDLALAGEKPIHLLHKALKIPNLAPVLKTVYLERLTALEQS